MFNTGTVMISLSNYDAMQANERELKEELANLKDKICDMISHEYTTDVTVYGEVKPETIERWEELADLTGFQYSEEEREKALKIHEISDLYIAKKEANNNGSAKNHTV